MSEKNTEISARIQKVLEILQEKPNRFAIVLGYNRSQTIYDILNGKSAPSYDFFNRFCLSEYSERINLRWLLSGEGEPTIKTEIEELVQPKVQDTSLMQLISQLKEQAEEIGRLKERIYQYEKEKQETGSSVVNASNTGIVNVG